MPFNPKAWQNEEGGGTAVSAEALVDLETRVTDFALVAGTNVATFAKAGVLSAVAGAFRFRLPAAATVLGVSATAGTAPTGASVIVDVNKNGTTIFTTQANRPAIAAGQNAVAEATPDVTAVAAGDYLTVDIDQVGSSVAGSDLLVHVRWRWV